MSKDKYPAKYRFPHNDLLGCIDYALKVCDEYHCRLVNNGVMSYENAAREEAMMRNVRLVVLNAANILGDFRLLDPAERKALEEASPDVYDSILDLAQSMPEEPQEAIF